MWKQFQWTYTSEPPQVDNCSSAAMCRVIQIAFDQSPTMDGWDMDGVLILPMIQSSKRVKGVFFPIQFGSFFISFLSNRLYILSYKKRTSCSPWQKWLQKSHMWCLACPMHLARDIKILLLRARMRRVLTAVEFGRKFYPKKKKNFTLTKVVLKNIDG